MRTIWPIRTICLASAALALAACNETAEPVAAPSAPATVATTNAKVEPVPTENAKPSDAAKPSTSAKPADPAKPAMTDEADDACGAGKAAAFIGRQDRPTTRADLARTVGHDRIRWIGPGDVVTMDFREDRLNVMLDGNGRLITGVRCG